MIIGALVKKLADTELVVPGQSLFRESMPAEISIGVMIRSPLTGISIDPYIRGWHKTKIQIITRHTDPLLGSKLAYAVSEALTIEGEEIIPETENSKRLRIVRFFPETLPVQFPRLKSNGIEISQNFRTIFAV